MDGLTSIAYGGWPDCHNSIPGRGTPNPARRARSVPTTHLGQEWGTHRSTAALRLTQNR
jgi:hypothetical protein